MSEPTNRMRLGLRVALACCALAYASALAAQDAALAPPADASFEVTLQRALDAYEQRDLASAVQLFERAHELAPSARTQRAVGIAWYELEDYEQAIPWLARALEDERRPLDAEQRREAKALLADARRRVLPASAPEPPAPAEPDAPAATRLGTRRIAALVTAGVGVIGVTIGSVYGLQSLAHRADYDELCPKGGCRDPRSAAAMNDAWADGDVSTVAWAVGAGALAGGLVLWLLGGDESDAARARLHVGPGALYVRAAF